jgi:signal transduction histidine kinase
MPADREQDLVLEGVVHDLNNVFQTILESVEVLAADEKWTSLARALRRSASRGQRIVTGLHESAPAALELEAIVEDAMQFASDVLRVLRISGIEFDCNVEPGIRLPGPPTAWERVLFNLLINAAQAMRSGGAIEIHGRRSAGHVEIIVEDNGPGIPPEILPRIFQARFSTRPAGSGLGLHIVKSIVRENGGTVTASNREGRPGACFQITVPMQTARA